MKEERPPTTIGQMYKQMDTVCTMGVHSICAMGVHSIMAMHLSNPPTSTFMPDTAIGGEVSAVSWVTRSGLALGRANLSHRASTDTPCR